MKVHYTHSMEDTQKLGEKLAATLKPGAVLALYGDLGSGKTTFTQGLAKGLGITGRIQSPTFVLMRDYDLPAKDNSQLHHLDLYRLQSDKELKSLNLNELVNEETSIFVIEWADKANQDYLQNAIKIYFKSLKENERKITIQS